MTFRSPWQNPLYIHGVTVLRRLLRPWPRLEERLIVGMVTGHNARVRRYLAENPAELVLLILPRCVKRRGCCADVQSSLDNCLECRECPLGDIARLCDRYGVTSLVAFRSHIAFAMARRRRPDLIIATACHDRLIKALRSVPEFPALLTPLAGMERQCVNAGIDLVWFERQLAAVTVARPTQADAGSTTSRTAGAS